MSRVGKILWPEDARQLSPLELVTLAMNGFLGVDGIHVYVLYPKGKVSAIQESQFVTLGRNITAIEVDGVFDDCQTLVKNAFMDEELNSRLKLTSANSINVAEMM